MKGFLELLAHKLYSQYGDDISSLRIILPNSRARLFFSEALSKIAGKPIWQPNFGSIDELFSQISALSVSDNIPLVAELYKVYKQHYKDEVFDTFYFWGEMLLSDFDSVDKYLLDAKMLFSNIKDLKDMSNDMSYLTKEQIEVINHFWQSFNSQREWSKEQKEFNEIWSKLYHIYSSFKENLRTKSMSYSGMMYREAVEKLKANTELNYFENQHFIIAGFNALSECEKYLFKYISKKCECEFYWDSDKYYLNNKHQEAGLFLRENLRMFPQKNSLGITDNFKEQKNIKVVSVPSDSLQCRYVNTFLNQIKEVDKRTAVVLTDENLLVPVIYSVPDNVENINITMGYPLMQSLAYSFCERLLELQKHIKQNTKFYHSDVVGILTHPYIIAREELNSTKIKNQIQKRSQAYISGEIFKNDDLLKQIFSPISSYKHLSEYLIAILSDVCDEQDSEAIMFFNLIIEHIYKITNSVAGLNIDVSTDMFVSLLRRTLQKIRVPYTGEPLLGLQIMGILETRNLDFENVIVLSMNDDNFPGNKLTSSSFIPYNLRMAYGLPTPTHHEGVYAYYFYRLLQRAKNIHLVYSCQSDDKKTGEKSRYIYQLGYESSHNIDYLNIELDVNLSQQSIQITKDEHVINTLKQYIDNQDKPISPSAFYSYVECSMKFYFKYIAKLHKPDELSEQVDSRIFGNILHEAMEKIYPKNGTNIKLKAKELINSKKVEEEVIKAIQEKYLDGDTTLFDEWSGNLLLAYNTILKYINQSILAYDCSHEDFSICDMEGKHITKIPINFNGKSEQVYIGGYIDRLDNLNAETLRVVDYKTGTLHKEVSQISNLFGDKNDHRSSAVLQTLIYSMVLSYTTKKEIQPALYYVRAMRNKDYSPLITDKGAKTLIYRYSAYKKEFEELFINKLNTIFDANVPFTQCEDTKTCEWCDYKTICQR